MPAYNIIAEHMQEQLRNFNSNDSLQAEDLENERSRLQINIMNADAKLQKYRALLTSPVYYAAVVLVPWRKWEYFEDHLSPEELRTARRAVQKLWDDEYADMSVDSEEPSSIQVESQVSKPIGNRYHLN